MKRLAVLALAITAVSGVAASHAALPALVTLDGVGGVVPGMTVRQTERAWGVRLNPQSPTPGCSTAIVRKGSLRGYALFENRKFGAVFFERGARTPSGIHIGSTRAQLVNTYGRDRLRFQRHAYVRGAWYVFLRRRTVPRWQIRFDLSPRGRVNQIAFGARAVTYIEACS